MASFKDKTGREWTVSLDPFLVADVKEKQGVNLQDLSSDPLLPLRNNPMKLVATIQILCQDQMQAKGMDPVEFGRSLPFPPDPMLEAVQEAIVGFFHSGRASHVREVLRASLKASEKQDEISLAKIRKVINDPATQAMLDQKADELIQEAMDSMMSIGRGSTDSEDANSSP